MKQLNLKSPVVSGQHLFDGVEIHSQLGGFDFMVQDLTVDSRQVKAGSLFIAVKGLQSDGHDYIAQAIENGAVAIVTDQSVASVSVPVIQVRNSRKAAGYLASVFYDAPSAKMKMIGVTGTNGKTTVAYLVESILKQAGMRVGLIGTVIYRWPGHEVVSERTTPDAIELQRILWEMRQAGVEWVVMEVSSHALALDRVTHIAYDVAIFTNLTQDHLDFHPNMDDYANTKALLFKNLSDSGVGIVYHNDPYSPFMVNACAASCITFGETAGADVFVQRGALSAEGASFDLLRQDDKVSLHTPLLGHFNVQNSAAAALACLELGLDMDMIDKGLNAIQGVPGRMEGFRSSAGFQVVVDYAHTPDALENALKTAREFTERQLITVFGCGGDRDRGKRPKMGKIAADCSNKVFVTSDNPRTEDPQAIIRDILSGIPARANIIVQEDREKAIQQAIQGAKEGDTVLVAGKGHEDYQIIGHQKHHFDDREIVRKCLSLAEPA